MFVKLINFSFKASFSWSVKEMDIFAQQLQCFQGN